MQMRDVALTEALVACQQHRVRTEAESVPVAHCAGRALAEDLRARVAVPQADTASMDGFAVRAGDTPGWLRVVGEHRAGQPGRVFVGEEEAARVSTGALMPAGADAVVPVEHTALHGELVEVPGEVERGAYVRRAGEVIMEGVLMLPAGMVLSPTTITAIGAVGHAEVPVQRAARVAVIGLGDELVPLGESLRAGQVYDANRVGVAAQAEAAGAEVVSNVWVGDDRDATVRALREALESDVHLVVTIGGLGAGPHDHVRPAMEIVGVDTVFHGVRVTPCRPTWLGVQRDGDTVALGLPGNPASAAIAFHLFGRTLLGRPATWDHRAPLGAQVAARADHIAAVRCSMRGGRLHPLASQAAHAVTTMAMADALALVEGTATAGTVVPWTAL